MRTHKSRRYDPSYEALLIQRKKITPKKAKRFGLNTVCFVLALKVSIFMALPFLYMVLMSFIPESNMIFTDPPTFFAGTLRWENFKDAWESIDMGKLLGNTLLMVVASMGIGLMASIFVAYGFSRFKNKFSNVFFMILLSTMMIPWVVTMIPSYALFERLGWIGTRLPLIIPWIGGSAFNVFMLKQFMDDIPKDLDEAAKIDGANSFTSLFTVILPQVKPCLATLLVYSFINSWCDFIGPSIYLQNPDTYTLSIGMQLFFPATGSPDWTQVMAGSLMFSIPMVLVLVFAQKAFVRGVVSSGIK